MMRKLIKTETTKLSRKHTPHAGCKKIVKILNLPMTPYLPRFASGERNADSIVLEANYARDSS